MCSNKLICVICASLAVVGMSSVAFAGPTYGLVDAQSVSPGGVPSTSVSSPRIAIPGTTLPPINPAVPRPRSPLPPTSSYSGSISLAPTSSATDPSVASRVPSAVSTRNRSAMPQSPFGPRPSLPPKIATIGAALPVSPTLTTSKPFSDFRMPSPVSPYMNLYRTDTSLGTIDNYTSLVRPMIQQQQFNQQASGQLRSLQTANQVQRQTIEQLQRGAAETGASGARQPAGFMQHGGFYQPR